MSESAPESMLDSLQTQSASVANKAFRFSIDRGGTFTDIFCEIRHEDGSKQHVTHKLLSEDPSNYKDAPTEGIRRLLEAYSSSAGIPREGLVPTQDIEYIRMGTTVATNALLERKGERVALLTTKGFQDLQVIGNQSRPKIFDLQIQRPDLLYETVHEVNERVIVVKDDFVNSNDGKNVVRGVSKELLCIEQALDHKEVSGILQSIYDSGIRSLAIVFMHAYTFSQHEREAASIAKNIGFTQISISSDVMPMVRIVPRGCTTCVDAYLTPVIKRYLHNFCQGFDENFGNVNITFMQSDGGLTPMNQFNGNKAILSGPAGGVVGYAQTSYHSPSNASYGYMPVIGFDMGGTSTDVSRYAGTYEHIFESTTAGVTIQSPQLDINTVAAGGGSRLFYKNELFVVGPESAGAHPGPISYKKGGYLAVTDANVVLGRIQPHLFPAIFGHSEKEELDFEAAYTAFTEVTDIINSKRVAQGQVQYAVDEVAYGFIKVANEAMARPIRNLTTMRGHDVTKHVLSCFGGAGPQHCCAIAKSLGMRRIYVNRFSGILSAYGLSRADIVVEKQEPFNSSSISEKGNIEACYSMLKTLAESARNDLSKQGFVGDLINITLFLNCRYQGTDTAIMVDIGDANDSAEACRQKFVEEYKREYGFELEKRDVVVDDIRVRAIGLCNHDDKGDIIQSKTIAVTRDLKSVLQEMVQVYFEGGRQATPVYLLKDLVHGDNIDGPAIIVQSVATVVIEPGCHAVITEEGDIEIDVVEAKDKEITSDLDPIYLSIFSHRFMGIAEQMGRTLQRTSISVNIKERLDFSCALFDPKGGLVANAPHLPVHLGAMSEAVRFQIRYWTEMGKENAELGLVEGDVLVSNHPQLAGGSHLPDITVITPIFHNNVIVFFVASRGHHADVGGIAPGSMPPLSKTLVQEGAAIIAFKLVREGLFQEAGITQLLQAPGQLENNFGTRNLIDNLSDLRAQVAANTRGAALMQELVKEYSLTVVQAYMGHIQDCAEKAVRDMLIAFSLQQDLPEIGKVHAVDYLDDGTPIALTVTIDRRTGQGTACFDFEGTGTEIYGNLNAPPAVTSSAIIYCLRCLLPDTDIPLNQGCLAPISIRIPQGCILNPSIDAAVVGGNVLTSQRVTDVVLKAFQACAASQGCMNNLTFGNSTMGYYETIAGGAGAGPSWKGCDGVHTHMTNTRITDAEILEKRYPVILREFSLRPQSGGIGAFNGGNGINRILEFTEPLTVSILSERRAFKPYGMKGGGEGSRGLNTLITTVSNSNMTKRINLGGKNTVNVLPGNTLIIQTPGGGAYGVQEDASVSNAQASSEKMSRAGGGSLQQYTMSQESA